MKGRLSKKREKEVKKALDDYKKQKGEDFEEFTEEIIEEVANEVVARTKYVCNQCGEEFFYESGREDHIKSAAKGHKKTHTYCSSCKRAIPKKLFKKCLL